MKKLFLYFLLFFLLCQSTIALDIVNFHSHMSRDVMSSPSITSVTKDKNGFIWISTQNELLLFDGNTYQNINPDINKRLFSKNNIVQQIYFFDPHQLWICTSNGLFIYDIRLHTLKQIDALADFRVNSLIPHNGKFYLNTTKGLIVLNPNDLTTYPLYTYGNKLDQMENTSFALDLVGQCFLFSKKKLLLLPTLDEMEERLAKKQPIIPDTLIRFSTNNRMKIDRFNEIWIWDRETLSQTKIGKDGKLGALSTTQIEISALLFLGNNVVYCNRSKENVILVRDKSGKIIEKKSYLIEQQYDDLTNTTNAFFADESNNIWLGTRNGLYMIPFGEKRYFINIRNNLNDPNSLSHNTSSDVYIENRNTAWIATPNGLDKISFFGNASNNYQIQRFVDTRTTINKVLDNKIEQIEVDGNGIFWLGTKGNLKLFNPKTNIYFTTNELANSLKHCSFVRSLYADKDKNMWIGFENGGAFFCDKNTGIPIEIKTPKNETVNCISITGNNQGNVWIGTKIHGILQVEKRSNGENPKLKQYLIQDSAYQETLVINAIYSDNYNNIWAGTTHGLYKYSYESDKFIAINLNLAENQRYISGMIGDNRGNLWIATLNGVYKYNISEGTGHLIVLNEGIFTRRSFVFGSEIDSDGYIYMTGINGLTIFNPNEIVSDTTRYNVFFTDFKVNNRSVISGDFALPEDINYTPKITLTHKNNQISFSFSALVYTNRENIRYAYKLEGVDPDWIFVGPEERYISYGNLPAGNYKLKVKSTNTNGIWQDNENSLSLRIKPPLMLTWYFWILYACLFAGLVWFVVNHMKLRLKLDSQKEFEENKLKLYTDLSHSLKTPLTLIQSPLESLIENYANLPDDEKQYMFSTMHRNTNRMSFIIDQIGEYRKVTDKKSKLSLVEADFISFVRGVSENFIELFHSKEIQFDFNSNVEQLILTYDAEKMEIVLLNLLSNAYKYTLKGGKVALSCNFDESEQMVEIQMNDNGIGIKKEDQERVFERFYAISDSETKRTGLGIGLSLVKEYVELHKSSIKLQSSDSGTRVTFELPLGSEHFHGSEVKKMGEEKQNFEFVDAYIESEMLDTEKEKTFLKNAPLVYLADEDLQLEKFIENMFSPELKVVSFKNPELLLEELENAKPELIISTILFNGVKLGLELCRKLKSDPNYNDIPFIFTTSYSGADDKQIGYEVGADAYILKPYNVNHLKKRAILLIQSKENIRKQVKRSIITNPQDVQIQSADDKFLSKAMQIIEEHIADENFNVDVFASNLNMSQSMLYRRVKGLTNISPNELIRSVRLKRAAQLLEKKAFTVSEVAFQVGFMDNRYFSTCFKKEFGVPPSVYAQFEKTKDG